MSSCCEVQPPTEPGTCPLSRTRGKPVAAGAVKALLTEAALRRFAPGDYWFCPASDCDIVYFSSAQGDRTFDTSELRAPVWQKEPFGRRLICYCFGENEADIAREVEETGRSLAETRVRDHIAAGRCACEVRNPRGICCLGDVVAAVKRVEAAVKVSR